MVGGRLTSLVCGERAGSDPGAVETALRSATAEAPKLRKTSSHDRALILDRVAAAIAARPKEIACALAEESGYLSAGDMDFEVTRAIEVLTLTAAHVREGTTEMLNVDAVDRARGVIGWVRREPIGPVLGITAYNGPLLIAVHKIAPAIAAGVPIVIKPSPRVVQAAINLARMVIGAGWPAAAIAVLDVDNDTTMRLIRDPRLPVISFTGGAFGWEIKAAVPHKRVHLELGGTGAVFVAADANLALAAQECAAGGFVRSGQSCISVQRIYVDRAVHDAFVRLFAGHVAQMQPGQPRAISPMVDEAAAMRVEALVRDAVAKGAQVVCGGQRNGAALAATVLTGATADMSVMRQEAFGPVVAISPVDSADEAVAEMNAVSGAIHHGVYTANLDLALRLTDQIRAAGVIVNGPGTWRVDHMPYGGTGTSGSGREGVRYAIEEYTEPKSIIIRPSVPG